MGGRWQLEEVLYVQFDLLQVRKSICSVWAQFDSWGIWVFPKIWVPQNGWFIMENLIKMDDLGYHYFWKHPYIDTEIYS